MSTTQMLMHTAGIQFALLSPHWTSTHLLVVLALKLPHPLPTYPPFETILPRGFKPMSIIFKL
jgi:hypothetical protein